MDVGAIHDGDARFARGLNSFSSPEELPPESYVFSVNMWNRGGVLQARPGFRAVAELPDGNPQALTVFSPRTGTPQLVAVVAGQVYVSNLPFKTFHTVGGEVLSDSVKKVYSEQAIKSVERNQDGSLRLISPRTILMLQDGESPAAYYDGQIVRFLVGENLTPSGTHMAWDGARLWVARGNQLFASDIADPLSYIEQVFNTLGGISYYILPDNVTGLARTPGTDLPQLLAFTDSTTTTFRSDIRDRSLWTQTPDFQRMIMPTLGCVSDRSICPRAGTLNWFSSEGVTQLDAAFFSQHSTRIDYLDNEMIRSKSRLSSDLSGIAGIGVENFLLMSVPHADKYNRHTWVMDASTVDLLNEDLPPAWSSVWTGIRPVQWVTVKVNGRTRVFCLSKDFDGKNRVYEAFAPEQRDNGCDFPWMVETRAYGAGSAASKTFRFLAYEFSELRGLVDIVMKWAGSSRGPWKRFATFRFDAAEGMLDATKKLNHDTPIYALKPQSRSGRTMDVLHLADDPLGSENIDGDVRSLEDLDEMNGRAFQFRIEGSGPCAIRLLRLFMDNMPEPQEGQVADPEAGGHNVRFDGAASANVEDLDVAPVTYSATKSAEARYNNFAAAATATIVSTISQLDADKRALQSARARAERELRRIAAPHVGGGEL